MPLNKKQLMQQQLNKLYTTIAAHPASKTGKISIIQFCMWSILLFHFSGSSRIILIWLILICDKFK